MFSVVSVANCALTLTLKAILFMFTHAHPFLVNPVAQVSQLFGPETQVAHESSHLIHFINEPEKSSAAVNPALHSEHVNSVSHVAHPVSLQALQTPFGPG